MTKKTIRKVRNLILRAEKIKNEIAFKRDKLLEVILELEDISSSIVVGWFEDIMTLQMLVIMFNDGIEEMEGGIRSLNTAADSLSQYL